MVVLIVASSQQYTIIGEKPVVVVSTYYIFTRRYTHKKRRKSPRRTKIKLGFKYRIQVSDSSIIGESCSRILAICVTIQRGNTKMSRR